MNNFFRYLAPTQDEKRWGIYLTVAGNSNGLPGMDYPFGKHPKGYQFRWENGRILSGRQVFSRKAISAVF
jgi:hypothetical protein